MRKGLGENDIERSIGRHCEGRCGVSVCWFGDAFVYSLLDEKARSQSFTIYVRAPTVMFLKVFCKAQCTYDRIRRYVVFYMKSLSSGYPMVSMKSYIKPHTELAQVQSATSIPSRLFADQRNSLMHAFGWDFENWFLRGQQVQRMADHPCLWTDEERAIKVIREPEDDEEEDAEKERKEKQVMLPPTIIVIPVRDTYMLAVVFAPEDSNGIDGFYEACCQVQHTPMTNIPMINAQLFRTVLSCQGLREALGEGSVFWKMRQCEGCGIMDRKMKRCEKCTTHYCCVECQRGDWLSHRQECKTIRKELKKWQTPRDGRKDWYMRSPLGPQRWSCTEKQALKLLRRVTGIRWKVDEGGQVCRKDGGNPLGDAATTLISLAPCGPRRKQR